MSTLDLTCSCGARLVTTSKYAGDVARERRAFDQAHAECRQAPSIDDHAYDALVEVRALCDPVPDYAAGHSCPGPPPDRPDPLPDPVIPSS